MKILVLYKQGGSKYHRLLLPLSKMGVTFTNKLSEDLISKFDCLWIHSMCDIHPTQLSLWRLKYNFQIVVDVDDTWNISPSHPSYQGLIKQVPIRKQFAMIADWIVCSTPEIEFMVKPFNENTIVVPNRIPYGEGQYHIRQESLDLFMNRKIRIGFCGSISHMDDWLSISGKMKRVLSDGEIKQKCEFVIAGVGTPENKNKDWMYNKAKQELANKNLPITESNINTYVSVIEKQFIHYNNGIWNKCKSVLGQPKIITDKPVDNYIDLYREIDILLCPLLDTDLNRKKSSLKIYEAACTDTYCILGTLYKNIDPISNLYPFEDWYNNIKSLIKDKEKLYHLKMNTSEQVRQSDYLAECVVPRQSILGIKKKIKLPVWGITYKEDQLTEYIPYVNKVNSVADKSYLFENNVILNLFNK